MAGLAREGDVRALVEEFNDEVREAFRRPVTGSPMTVELLDPDTVLTRWRTERTERTEFAERAESAETVAQDAAERAAHAETGAPRPHRWWRRRRS